MPTAVGYVRFSTNEQAEHERKLISERTRAALGFKQTEGQWIGLVPFGFAVNGDGALDEVPAELRIIATMKRWRRRGASYREIAGRLNDQGVKTPRGKWGKSAIARLVNEHTKTRKARYITA